MKVLDGVRLGVIQAVALGGALLSLAISSALAFPGSEHAEALAKMLPLAEVHWQSAETALVSSPSDAATAAAEREADAEVAAAPNRLQPYLQRAFIRVRAAHGALSPEAFADFAHTYDLSLADPSAAPWRERFAYNHWQELTVPLRETVMREHVLTWNMHQAEFAALDGDIHNGAGRIAYRLTQRDALKDFWARRAKAKDH